MFAATAAHDLRAPLSTIRGYAEALEDLDRERLSSAGTHALDALQDQVLRMSTLIDTILSFSTAASAAEIENEELALSEAVDHVIGDLHDLIDARGAELHVGDLPTVTGSPMLIERTIQNLLANAVAYGAAGHPEVWIDSAKAPAAHGLSISDNGNGVPAQERADIFEMFVRGTTGRSAGAGTGIGLAFARRVAERHGGTLTVDDAPCGGARFTLLLPDDEDGGDVVGER